jgi:hypothetical protein
VKFLYSFSPLSGPFHTYFSLSSVPQDWWVNRTPYKLACLARTRHEFCIDINLSYPSAIFITI